MRSFIALAALSVGLADTAVAQTIDTPNGKITTELGKPAPTRVFDEVTSR